MVGTCKPLSNSLKGRVCGSYPDATVQQTGGFVGIVQPESGNWGYVQLLFFLLWPLEQLSEPYSQERAMYDAHRAIILEAVDKGIWSGT